MAATAAPAAAPLSGVDRARLQQKIREHAPPGTIGYAIGRQPSAGSWEYWPPRRAGTLPFLRFDQLPPSEWVGVFVLFYWTAELRPLPARGLPEGLYLPRR